jgi:hypothetical protein
MTYRDRREITTWRRSQFPAGRIRIPAGADAPRIAAGCRCRSDPGGEVNFMKIKVQRVEEIKATAIHPMPNIPAA